MSFEIQLQHFQGPFDLLLFFIERDELNVHDIPIARITDDFLAYLHKMQELNLEVASEFILVAATLMRIKAKMLLPRKELDAQGNEIDPRAELVDRLLAYKQFKDILEEIRQMEENRLLRVHRGNLEQDLLQIREKFVSLEELHSLDLYKLLKTFHKVMNAHEERQQKPTHVVFTYPFTMDGMKEKVLQTVMRQGREDFVKLLEACTSKLEAIFLFLSVLELLQQQLLQLSQGEGYNNFWLTGAVENKEE